MDNRTFSKFFVLECDLHSTIREIEESLKEQGYYIYTTQSGEDPFPNENGEKTFSIKVTCFIPENYK